MKCCAIVVLYEPTAIEIKNICDYCDKVDMVFVMDNSLNSNEELVAKEIANKRKISHYVYNHFGRNIGLCKAFNIAMSMAAEQNCEWALLMDADSRFITDIVSVYKNFLVQNTYATIGVLAPVHIHERKYERDFEGCRNVRWAMTSGCFYNVKIFHQNMGFKEELFVDGLDIDYCYKIGREGYQIIQISEAQLRHYPGETKICNLGVVKIKYGYASAYRYYMQARAIIWLILKYRRVNDIFRYFYKWMKVLLLFDNKKKYISELVKGSKEGIQLWRKDKIVLK